MSNDLTPRQKDIMRVLCAVAPGSIDTENILERLYWLRNRHNLKSQIYLMRRKGVAVRGRPGGRKYGGYYLELK